MYGQRNEQPINLLFNWSLTKEKEYNTVSKGDMKNAFWSIDRVDH